MKECDHPNIVGLIRTMVDEYHIYMFIEYVFGKDLHSFAKMHQLA